VSLEGTGCQLKGQGTTGRDRMALEGTGCHLKGLGVN